MNTRIVGATLVAVSVLTLFAMLHYPTVGSDGFADALEEIARERPLNGTVHGAMILFLALYYWGFSFMKDAVGGALVSWGLLAAALATAFLIGAAVISGFVFPEFAASVARHAVSEEIARAVMRLLHRTNQVLATLGIAAYGVALVAWGLSLRRLHRRLAALGLAGGLGSIGAVGADVSWGVTAATLFAAVLGLWSTAIGLWFWRGVGGVDGHTKAPDSGP